MANVGDTYFLKRTHYDCAPIMLNILSIQRARKKIIRNVLYSLYKEIYCLLYFFFFFSKEILAITFQIKPIEKIIR